MKRNCTILLSAALIISMMSSYIIPVGGSGFLANVLPGTFENGYIIESEAENSQNTEQSQSLQNDEQTDDTQTAGRLDSNDADPEYSEDNTDSQKDITSVTGTGISENMSENQQDDTDSANIAKTESDTSIITEFVVDDSDAVNPETGVSSVSQSGIDTSNNTVSEFKTPNTTESGIPSESPEKTEMSLQSVQDGFDYNVLNDTYCEITGYSGDAAELEIPETISDYTVQSIARNSFKNNSSLVKVTIPSTVETLGNSIFNGCIALEEVTFPKNLTAIPDECFRYCTSLKTFTFENAIQSIGASAFNGCTSLINVVLNNSIETIEPSAFFGCSGLKSISLSSSLKEIGESSFEGCSSLESIEIPDGVAVINRCLFKNCSKLEKVTMSAIIGAVNAYSFENCTGLTQLTLPDSITSMSAGAFKGCTSLSDVDLPIGWMIVKDYYDKSPGFTPNTPFEGCTSLTAITVPEGMTKIPPYAFRNMKSLTSVTFSDTVKSIGNDAFNGCTSLNNVVLNNSIETIEPSAFNGCNGLKSISLSSSLKEIGESSFEGCSSIESIEIPDGVAVINRCLFKNCSKLESVTMSAIIGAVNAYSFENCTGLTQLTLPDSITSMSAGVFKGCTSLSDVDLPIGWTIVKDSNDESPGFTPNTPFEGCTSLTAITVPEGMTKIPPYAFRNMKSLTSVTFSDTVESIGNDAFNGCSALTDPEFPDSLNTIEDNAFHECVGLRTLDLNEGLESIGRYSFFGCKGLTTLNLNEGLGSIGNYAFSGCDGLLSLVLNEELLTLSDYSFADCTNLTAARIPKSVTSFGSNSFNNCPKLTIYCYSGTAAHYAVENSSYEFYLLDNHEHDYEIEVGIAPTCTEGGSQKLTCSICSYNYIQKLEPLGHRECTNSVIREATCTAEGVTETRCNVCGYLVKSEITQPLGHRYEKTVAYATCTAAGFDLHTCTVCSDSYKDNDTDALGHTFGEWMTEKAATPYSEGSKYRECSRCHERETRKVEKMQIDISAHPEYGLVNFVIADAKTKEAIPNAQIYVSIDDENSISVGTDESGRLSQILPVGKLNISVYAEGYLPRNIAVTVASGEQDLPMIGISTQPLVEAQFTTTEMTYDEIVEAGIDTNASGNEHVYKYEIKFTFTPELDYLSIVEYFNMDGVFLGAFSESSDDNGGEGGCEGEEPDPPEDPGYSLHYHVDDGYIGHGWCKTVDVENNETVYLNYWPYRDEPDYRFAGWYADENYTQKIYHVQIEDRRTTVYGKWVYTGEGQEEPPEKKPRTYIKTQLQDETNVTIYPVSERFYLIIYGEVKWLKEMYNVQLVAINNSTTDTVEDCTAELTLPDGLSLADMKNGEQSLTQIIGHLDEAGSENSTKSVNWYVRGDSAGTYKVSAKLTGKLMPYEEEFSYEYTTNEPIKVYAGSAMHMTIIAPGVTWYNDDYTVRIELENVSHKSIYGLSHVITGLKQCKVTTYSDDSEETETYVNQGELGKLSINEFKPGDKMVIEITTNIMFESELIEQQIENLTGVVDQVESLMSSYKCFKTGAEMIGTFGKTVKSASSNIDKIVKAQSVSETDISKAYKGLASTLSSLTSKMNSGDSKALKVYKKLEKTGALGWIEEMSNSSEFYDAHTAAEILKMIDSINGVIKSEDKDESEPEDDSDIYDSIKTAIEAIPIRFILRNAAVTTLEGSTTEIPYTIVKGDTNAAKYFGVESVGKYLYNLVIAGTGEVDVPWYFNVLGAEDDPTGYNDAVEYIKATEAEISKVTAQSATGKTSFRAWVEPSGVSQLSLYGTEGADSSDDFKLSSENETASVDENGVLTFTGAGYIDVTPVTSSGGVLYVQMEEDGETKVSSFVIDVVDKHVCSSDTWVSTLEPSDDTEGYMVKKCSICDDVIDIKSVSSCENHSYGDYIIETEATEDSYGLKSKSCSVCGFKKYRLITSVSENEQSTTSAALYQEGDYIYSISGGAVTITSYNGDAVKLTIPYSIAGYPVRMIGYEAFEDCGKLEKIVFGKNIERIGDYAFDGCAALTDIYICSADCVIDGLEGLREDIQQVTVHAPESSLAAEYVNSMENPPALSCDVMSDAGVLSNGTDELAWQLDDNDLLKINPLTGYSGKLIMFAVYSHSGQMLMCKDLGEASDIDTTMDIDISEVMTEEQEAVELKLFVLDKETNNPVCACYESGMQ